jgi:hypothetical protein
MQPYSRNNFLPGPLMGNQGGFGFRYGAALPAKPNILSSIQKPQAVKATAEGVNQVANKMAQDRPTKADSKLSKYKTDAAHHAQGNDAFASLDSYMKKAGLNSFQTQFFTRLIQAGLPQQSIKIAVKQAGDLLGQDVTIELNQGFDKLAFEWSKIPSYASNPIGHFNDWMTNTAAKAIDKSQTGQSANSFLGGMGGMGGMGDMLKQIAPYAMLSMLGAGGGGILGGKGGGMLGGIGLPLMMYLLSQQNGGNNMFGNFMANLTGKPNMTPEQKANQPLQTQTDPNKLLPASNDLDPGFRSMTNNNPAKMTADPFEDEAAPPPAAQPPAPAQPPANPTPPAQPPAPAQPASPPGAQAGMKLPMKSPTSYVASTMPKPPAYRPPTSGQLG